MYRGLAIQIWGTSDYESGMGDQMTQYRDAIPKGIMGQYARGDTPTRITRRATQSPLTLHTQRIDDLH